MKKRGALALALALGIAACGSDDDVVEPEVAEPEVAEAELGVVQTATYEGLAQEEIDVLREQRGEWAASPPGTAACRHDAMGRPLAWIVLPPDTETIAEALTQWAEAGWDGGLDYVLPVAPIYGFGPADEPTAASGISPDHYGDAVDGADVTIVVADMGYVEPPMLPKQYEHLLRNLDQRGAEERLPASTSDPARAHGLTVAAVAAFRAPGATVLVANAAVDQTGSADRSYISVRSFGEAITDDSLDLPGGEFNILNMSFGTYTCDFELLTSGTPSELSDRYGDLADFQEAVQNDSSTVDDLAELSLAGLVTVFESIGDTFDVLVAAAGNNDTDDPFYPASLDSVIGVGAVDDTIPNTTTCITGDNHVWSTSDDESIGSCDAMGTKAPFSNHGVSVEVWAPGADIVTAYPTELEFEYSDGYTVKPAPLVRISGTSFAAPYVAAEIATCLEAWDEQGEPTDHVTECRDAVSTVER